MRRRAASASASWARGTSRSRRAAPAGADRFAGVDWTLGPGGVPLLADAVATLTCAIVAEHAAGDHWIVVARVEAARVSSAAEPLVFFAGGFGTVR